MNPYSHFSLCSVGSFPQEIALYKRVQSGSSPQGAVLHELFQHGSFHWVQSFKIRLGSPQNHRWCQQTSFSVESPVRGATGHVRCLFQAQAYQEVTASLCHPPALSWGPPGALGHLSSGVWSTSSLFLQWSQCLQGCFSHIFSTAVLWKVDFFPVLFSNLLSQGCCHGHGQALPQPAADQSWSWLALALSDQRDTSGSLSQKLPL